MYVSRVDKTITFETNKDLLDAQTASLESGDIFYQNKVFDMTWVDNSQATEP